MDMCLVKGIFSILLLQLCKSHEAVTSKTPLIDIKLPTTVATAKQPKVTEDGIVDSGEDHTEVSAQHIVADKTLDTETGFEEEATEKIMAPADEQAIRQKGQNADGHTGKQAGEIGDHKLGADQEAAEKVTSEILGEPEAVIGQENVQNIGALTTEVVDLKTEEAPGEVAGEHGEMGVAVGASQEKASHKTETEGDTLVPPRLHGFDGGDPQQESNAVGREIIEESNYFNEILASNDEFANLGSTLAGAMEKVPTGPPAPLLKETGDHHDLTEEQNTSSDIVAPGIEAWKIGGIFAAMLLMLETAVIAIYCLKCKRRTLRRREPAIKCEECEAAQCEEWGPGENVCTGGPSQICEGVLD